jgi:hypothetical protein
MFSLRKDGAESDSLGIGFSKPRKHSGRAFRAVFPKIEPYLPQSEAKALVRLAVAGTADSERFNVFSSRRPGRDLRGKLVLRFGDVFVVPSGKNFIVENEAGEVVLVMFRSSSGTCSLRIEDGVSELTAFAIAIAAVVGK